jgi:hypothetical protein
MVVVGQVSDPYDDPDDDLGITISGLPEDLLGAGEDGVARNIDVESAHSAETGGGEAVGDDELEYNLDEWSVLEHQAVTERLLEAGIPHRWDGPRLYVALADEAAVEAVLDAVEGETDPLDPERDQVAYDLSEWDDDRIGALVEELDRASIPFAWDGDELFVYADDEQSLDESLDKVAHPHELAAENDDGDAGGELLGELFIAADRLQRDPDDHETTVIMLDLVRAAEAAPPPYGLSQNEWKHLRERMNGLADLLRDPSVEENAVLASARDLRNALRPYV